MGDVAQEGRTVLFVSHNMAAVQQLCQYGMVLTEGTVNMYGPIEEAVRSYMQGVETILHGSDLFKRKDRKGSQWLKFTRVAVYDDAGDEVQQAMSGKNVRIRLYYESSREKKNATVNVAFAVKSIQGFLIANLNSLNTGQSRLDIYSKGYFECFWPKFNLRSGSYLCNLFCAVNGEVVDWITNAFDINVEDGDYYGSGKLMARGRGDILIDHSWLSGIWI
jgi:lipopolysaccharide transport system ATP-binding protein